MSNLHNKIYELLNDVKFAAMFDTKFNVDSHVIMMYQIVGKEFLRYEKLRKLNPRQFAELYDANLKTGKPFDELVDELE